MLTDPGGPGTGAIDLTGHFYADDYDAGWCLDWPSDPAAGSPFPQGTRLADVPVRVLAGDLDANTSSVSGRETAAQFPQGISSR